MKEQPQLNPGIRYYSSANYKGNCGDCQTTHYIRFEFLEQVVLGEIRRLTKFCNRYEDDFVKAVIGSAQKTIELERKIKQKEIAMLQDRDKELDDLFERMYEDNVSGKLTDERFGKMSRKYEDEQQEIASRLKTLHKELDKLNCKTANTDHFLAIVRKYTRAKKLTPRMLTELIDRIEVYQSEKIDGVWQQRLTIHYNCVGVITIPEEVPLPAPEVSMNTRRGVVVNYAADQTA